MDRKITHLKSRLLFFAEVIGLVIIQIFQGFTLNFFIIKSFEGHVVAYLPFVGDLICLVVFILTSRKSYQYFLRQIKTNPVYRKQGTLGPNKEIIRRFGILPLCYISWSVYTFFLLGKVVTIFSKTNIAQEAKFDPSSTDGRKILIENQILQIIIGLSCLVFLLLAECHNWNKKTTECYSYVTSVCKKTGIEIFDSVEILAVLLLGNSLPRWVRNVVFGLASANFLIPTLSLFQLSITNFGKITPTRCLIVNIIHNALKLFLIDVPFLIVRMYLWLAFDEDVSMFMMKNMFYLILGSRDLYLDLLEFHKRKKEKKQNIAHARNAEEIALNNIST